MRYNRRKYWKPYYIVFSILVVILTISTGYAIFSESLNISGTADANWVASGNVLDLQLTQTGGRYSTGTPSNTNFTSESLIGNELTATFARRSSNKTNVNTTFTLPFRSKYPDILSSGAVATQIVSGGTRVVTLTASVNPTTINGKSTGTLTVNLRHNNGITTQVNLLMTMQYNVQGITQYFYFRIIIN